METIEVWMWIIAGIIIAGLTMAGAYNLFTDYTHTTELATAQKAHDSLISSINYICSSGTGSRDIKTIIFPQAAEQLYAYAKELDLKGRGNQICIKVSGQEAQCKTLSSCSITMDTIYFQQDTNLFYQTQRAAGKKNYYNIRFVLNRERNQQVNASWGYLYAD